MRTESGQLTLSAGPRLKTAFAIAMIVDLVQMVVFPLFVEGAMSPPDDLIDLAAAGLLTGLLGWQWEFLPSFAAKLLPGVDLVPLWTLAVANVYRKSKAIAAAQGSVVEGSATEADWRRP